MLLKSSSKNLSLCVLVCFIACLVQNVKSFFLKKRNISGFSGKPEALFEDVMTIKRLRGDVVLLKRERLNLRTDFLREGVKEQADQQKLNAYLVNLTKVGNELEDALRRIRTQDDWNTVYPKESDWLDVRARISNVSNALNETAYEYMLEASSDDDKQIDRLQNIVQLQEKLDNLEEEEQKTEIDIRKRHKVFRVFSLIKRFFTQWPYVVEPK